jgi:hypothetical protein
LIVQKSEEVLQVLLQEVGDYALLVYRVGAEALPNQQVLVLS